MRDYFVLCIETGGGVFLSGGVFGERRGIGDVFNFRLVSG